MIFLFLAAIFFVFSSCQNVWTSTGAMPSGRYGHTLNLFGSSGNAVAIGGAFGSSILNTGAVYNTASGTWANVANAMSLQRTGHTATTLPNGNVLICGGTNGASFHSSCEYFSSTTSSFAPGPTMMLGKSSNFFLLRIQ